MNDLISRAALLEEIKNSFLDNRYADSHMRMAHAEQHNHFRHMVNDAPAVEAVSKAAYDDLYAKYCELARLTNEVMPQLMKLMREFNANAPQKEAKEPKKGEWITASLPQEGYRTYCSNCKKILLQTPLFPYEFCPRCGAMMEGSKNE